MKTVWKWLRRLGALLLMAWAAFQAMKMIKGHDRASKLSDDIDKMKKRRATRKEEIEHARDELSENAAKAAASKERVKKVRDRIRGDVPAFDDTLDNWMRRVDPPDGGTGDGANGGDPS